MSETIVQNEVKRIALVGNPNSGKSSLFNHLTGLRQQVGNYPGVTVDKKSGKLKLESGRELEVLDLPGTYSIHPQSLDEAIVLKELLDKEENRPELIVYTADAENLSRNLLLFSQINDLGYSCILVLTMPDRVKKAGKEVDLESLSKSLGCPVVQFNGVSGEGLDQVKEAIENYSPAGRMEPLIKTEEDEADQALEEISEIFPDLIDKERWYYLFDPPKYLPVNEEQAQRLTTVQEKYMERIPTWRRRDTMNRYVWLNRLVRSISSGADQKHPKWDAFDRFVTHPFWGYLIFLSILFVVFQAIFNFASYPMDWIDAGFAWLSSTVNNTLPEGILNDLICEGVIPGLGGVLIFIPQIAILFFFIKLMEETGYMSRVVFLMDRLMRPFGLSGKSVVPLMSGVACAIPAIMATRNIENWRERMLTILVTPFMTCAARLPVYTILIALMVPADLSYGPFGVQGLVLLGMYLIGTGAALLSAMFLRLFVKAQSKSALILEMPVYRVPNWKNVGISVYEKSKSFVVNAGKIIFIISIVLWFLASYSPTPKKLDDALAAIPTEELSEEELDYKEQSVKLEYSYAGRIGQFIEPVIAPLGYDWKIGIALVTSFAAREVFVGTLATIYSVGSDAEDERSIMEKMKNERNPETGKPRYSAATIFSLLIFYAFAMQCMSTVAIVKKETKTWKWALFQLFYMSGLAYVLALLAYQMLK